jgi:hypothetical protein
MDEEYIFYCIGRNKKGKKNIERGGGGEIINRMVGRSNLIVHE